MKLRKIYRKLYQVVIGRISPVKYARKIGVNLIPGEIFIYGNISWSTEPWLITIGRNVHITAGVHFVTHDGGTLLFRNLVPDLEITKPITIGNDVYIGTNAMIMP